MAPYYLNWKQVCLKIEASYVAQKVGASKEKNPKNIFDFSRPVCSRSEIWLWDHEYDCERSEYLLRIV